MTADLSLQTCVRQADRVAARAVDGKAVVVVMDTRKLHVINPVGSRVWDLADGRSIAEIAGTIVDEFAVDRDTAERDVLAFIQELAAIGAVELRSAQTTPGDGLP